MAFAPDIRKSMYRVPLGPTAVPGLGARWVDAINREIGLLRFRSPLRAPFRHSDDGITRREIPQVALREVFAGGRVRHTTGLVALRQRQAGPLPLVPQPFLERNLLTFSRWQCDFAGCSAPPVPSRPACPGCGARVHVAGDVRDAFIPNNGFLVLPAVQPELGELSVRAMRFAGKFAEAVGTVRDDDGRCMPAFIARQCIASIQRRGAEPNRLIVRAHNSDPRISPQYPLPLDWPFVSMNKNASQSKAPLP